MLLAWVSICEYFGRESACTSDLCDRSIKRVIFETVYKFTGSQIRRLTVPEIRQIAGRAGRYRTSHQAIQEHLTPPATIQSTLADSGTEHLASSTHSTSNDDDQSTFATSMNETTSAIELYPTPPNVSRNDPIRDNIGLVTTLEQADFNVVKQALITEPPPIKTCAVDAPPHIVARFASYFPPGTPFSYILLRLQEISQISPRFQQSAVRSDILIADIIHPIEDLTIEDRLILCKAPLGRDDQGTKLIKELAECVSYQRGGGLLELRNMNLDILNLEATGTKNHLKALETLHKSIVLYLWVSFRFPGIFTSRPLANHVKGLVEVEIEKTLRLLRFDPQAVRKARAQKRKMSKVEEEILNMMKAGKAEEGGHLDGYGNISEDGVVSLETAEVASREQSSSKGLGSVQMPTKMFFDKAKESISQDDEGEYPEDGIIDDPSLTDEMKGGEPIKSPMTYISTN